MKILMIAPAWVGDTVMAQGLFKAIKLQYPQAQIDVLAPEFIKPLLACMPEIHAVFSLPFKHGEFNFLGRLKLGRSLKNQAYDQAFVLPNSWKSALIPFFANIPIRIGWLGEMRLGLLNRFLTSKNKKKYPLMLERFVALSEKSPNNLVSFYPKLSYDLRSRQKTIEKFQIDHTLLESQKIIILCPGAEYGSSKRWPENYFAETAQYFIQQGYEIWLLGSTKDKPVTDKINQLSQSLCKDFTGLTTLEEAIHLISLGKYIITNDSGLMHIAAALDRNIVALYGSTSPDFTPPLSLPEKTQILYIDPKELTCRPCFQRECPLKHHRCMQDLHPQRVIEAINTIEKSKA